MQGGFLIVSSSDQCLAVVDCRHMDTVVTVTPVTVAAQAGTAKSWFHVRSYTGAQSPSLGQCDPHREYHSTAPLSTKVTQLLAFCGTCSVCVQVPSSGWRVET